MWCGVTVAKVSDPAYLSQQVVKSPDQQERRDDEEESSRAVKSAVDELWLVILSQESCIYQGAYLSHSDHFALHRRLFAFFVAFNVVCFVFLWRV